MRPLRVNLQNLLVLYTYASQQNATNTLIEGITIANSPHHAINLHSSKYNEDTPVDVKWVKIFTWRSNGDGIDPGENGLIEDCFIRTQDDSTYVNGRGIRRVVYWEDSNGATFVLHPLGAVLPDAVFLTIGQNCSRVN